MSSDDEVTEQQNLAFKQTKGCTLTNLIKFSLQRSRIYNVYYCLSSMD